ncbi:MAG: hypothetical protein LBV06_00820 [Propionibacteriaceae bacterium]|nr:hypothetical protein [Propionibacteriaceae bacterium]
MTTDHREVIERIELIVDAATAGVIRVGQTPIDATSARAVRVRAVRVGAASAGAVPMSLRLWG